MLVIDVSKVDAISVNKFRQALAEKDIAALTVKNSLARKALHSVGVESLDDVLAGASTLVWGLKIGRFALKMRLKPRESAGRLNIQYPTRNLQVSKSSAINQNSCPTNAQPEIHPPTGIRIQRRALVGG